MLILSEIFEDVIELLERKNFKQLYRKTSTLIRERSTKITVKFLRKLKTGKFLYKTITKPSNHKYNQYIIPLATKRGKWLQRKSKIISPYKTSNISISDDVILHCTCDFFKYNLEVALKDDNVSVIKLSNGQQPLITNPKKKKYLCKHLVAVMPDYMKRIKL